MLKEKDKNITQRIHTYSPNNNKFNIYFINKTLEIISKIVYFIESNLKINLLNNFMIYIYIYKNIIKYGQEIQIE